MPDIRYVCISDMHLGEEDSVLTCLQEGTWEINWSRPSPTLRRLVECMKFLIGQNETKTKPTLILMGDILEFAVAPDNQAAMAFERFVELIAPKEGPLFEKIVYVPGNHDHHLWESARETQYVEYIQQIKPGAELPLPYHTTSMFVEDKPPLKAYFLTRLIQRYSTFFGIDYLKDYTVGTAYPNFGIVDNTGNKSVIFHHGHFVESLYHLVTTVKNLVFPDSVKPATIYDIENENFAWIDFFWSAVGRSGDFGRDVDLVYEKMLNPEKFRAFLKERAKVLAKAYNLAGWGDWMEEKLLDVLADWIADSNAKSTRASLTQVLGEDAEQGLAKYLKGPLKAQILTEHDRMPSGVTFVFGHTHKPFQKDMKFGKGYPNWVPVYNTGGWVVDTEEPTPLIGGALLLVDEDLNAISLRMYNEAKEQKNYRVSVERSTHAGDTSLNPFYQRMLGLVQPGQDPWKSFSETAATEVKYREGRARVKPPRKGRRR